MGLNIKYGNELDMSLAFRTKDVKLDDVDFYLPGGQFWPGRTDIVPVGPTYITSS